MRLTVYTDYALRALMYVAARPDRLSTIAEISTAYGISRNHLMKVVNQLAVAGFVETVRGHQGGLRLARPPEAINLADVVRQTEGDSGLVPCMDAAQPGYCAISPACRLKGALAKASQAFFSVLEDFSLEDLTKNREVLQGLLQRAPAAETVPG